MLSSHKKLVYCSENANVTFPTNKNEEKSQKFKLTCTLLLKAMTHNHACVQTLGNKCAWETNAGTATHTQRKGILL